MDSSFSEVEFDKHRMSSKLNKNQEKDRQLLKACEEDLVTCKALVNEDIHWNDLELIMMKELSFD